MSFAASHLTPTFGEASDDFRFATAVMGFADVLRGSEYATGWSLAQVAGIADDVALTPERRELVELVRRARQLRGETSLASIRSNGR